MNIKGLIVLFLVIVLVPVFLGEVKAPQFNDFLKNPNISSFKEISGKLLRDDYNFYSNLISSWIGGLVKEKIREAVK